MNKYYKLIYTDDDIIVLSKEHGVYVIPDRENKALPLIDILRDDFGKVFVTHRLDYGTGGVMVFARNNISHKNLSSQFENKIIEKTYTALIKGSIYSHSLMLPIAFGGKGKYKINFKSGKKAVTSFYNISSKNGVSLIKAIPQTGRTHQIRVHLKALKSPLYQDFLYNSKIDDKRLTLFASSITFTHPKKNKKMIFSTNLSSFMQNFINILEI